MRVLGTVWNQALQWSTEALPSIVNPIDHPDKVSNGCSHTDKIHMEQVYSTSPWLRSALGSESGPSGGRVAWGDAKGRHSPLTWPRESQFVFRLLRFIFTWRQTNSGKQAASGSEPRQKGRVPASAVFTWESICFESLKSGEHKGITGVGSERKTRNEVERNFCPC